MAELLKEAERARPHSGPYKDEEHRIQCACVRWFRYQYPMFRRLLFAVPNGGARSKATAGKLKAEGVVAGVSDLILLVGRGSYKGLCIEMKRPKGTQSAEQKAWQRDVEQEGYLYIICRSFDDFVQKVGEYLSKK